MSILIMIILLSILILVHEAGHFIAAKAFGIKVEKFGFGLPVGPTLFRTKWGDTEILVHAFLLGGYVAFPDSEENCNLPKESNERFLNRPIHQRAVVVSAGVFANVVCAFVLVFMAAIIWGHMPSGKYEIYAGNIVAPKTESIWQSGMQNKDKIVAINGSKIDSTYALLDYVRLSKANDGKIDASAADSTYKELKDLNPVLSRDEIVPSGVAVVLPKTHAEAPLKLDSKVLKGLKQYKGSGVKLTQAQAKLRDSLKNKKIYVSDGNYSMNDIAYAISDGVRPVNIQVERNGKFINLKPIYPNKKGLIGIRLEAKEVLIPTKTPVSVIKTSTKYLYNNTYMMLYGLYQLCTGQIPWQDMHGIIAITKVGGDIIHNSGMFYGLLLTALISMDLAIVNFLPIPALDGGHVLFLIIEKFRGKPLNEKIIDKVGNFCFYLLVIFMFVLIFNDIFGLITKKF